MKKGEEYYYNQLYNRRTEKSLKNCSIYFIGLVLLLVLSILVTGCKNTQYIPVEKVKIEYVNRTDTVNKIDTLISEKETIIKEADSSLVAKFGLQLKANEKAILILKRELERQVSKELEHKTDTVIKTDTIQIPCPIEKKLTKWEQAKMDAGGIAIGVCIVVVLMIIIGFLVKAYRKT